MFLHMYMRMNVAEGEFSKGLFIQERRDALTADVALERRPNSINGFFDFFFFIFICFVLFFGSYHSFPLSWEHTTLWLLSSDVASESTKSKRRWIVFSVNFALFLFFLCFFLGLKYNVEFGSQKRTDPIWYKWKKSRMLQVALKNAPPFQKPLRRSKPLPFLSFCSRTSLPYPFASRQTNAIKLDVMMLHF